MNSIELECCLLFLLTFFLMFFYHASLYIKEGFIHITAIFMVQFLFNHVLFFMQI